MLHLRLAEIAGSVHVDAVVDSLTRKQLLEWWAYGCLNGWFVDPDALKKGGMDVTQSLDFFEGLSGGGNNDTQSGVHRDGQH